MTGGNNSRDSHLHSAASTNDVKLNHPDGEGKNIVLSDCASVSAEVSPFLSISKFDECLCSAICLLSGVLTFFIYYQMTLSFVALEVIWPNQFFFNILGGFEYGASAVVLFSMIPYNGFRRRYFYIACLIYIFVALAFPLVVALLPGRENFEVARFLLALASLLTGAADGFLGLVGLSMAALLPKNRVGLVTAGGSLSGLIPWALFLPLSQCVFDRSLPNIKALIFTFFSFAAFLAGIQIICVAIISRRRWFKMVLSKASGLHDAQFVEGVSRWKQVFLCHTHRSVASPQSDQTEGAETSHYLRQASHSEVLLPPPRRFTAIMKDCGLHAFSALFLIVVTMTLYPAIVPYGLHQDHFWNTMLHGISHVVHTAMRFCPVYFSCFHVPRRWLLPLIILRCIIVFPLFIAINRYSYPTDTSILHSPWFLILCIFFFSGTHGWFATLSSMYVVSSVSHPQEKAIASKVLLVAQLLACAIGQFSGKLPTSL